MTREEREKAIEMLKVNIHCEDKGDEEDMRIALDMAISALKQMPETTTNNDHIEYINYPIITCDDAISREAVLDTTICEGISCNECSFNEIDGKSGCLLHARIDALPPVTPSRRKGHWILAENQDNVDNENDNYQYYCSECDHADIHATNIEVPYCWYCGTDMRGEK